MISYPADPIVEELLNLIKRRSDEGMKKFGQPLTRTDLPADHWRKNAIEELIDLLLYLQRSMKTRTEVELHYGRHPYLNITQILNFIYGDANGI